MWNWFSKIFLSKMWQLLPFYKTFLHPRPNDAKTRKRWMALYSNNKQNYICFLRWRKKVFCKTTSSGGGGQKFVWSVTRRGGGRGGPKSRFLTQRQLWTVLRSCFIQIKDVAVMRIKIEKFAEISEFLIVVKIYIGLSDWGQNIGQIRYNIGRWEAYT